MYLATPSSEGGRMYLDFVAKLITSSSLIVRAWNLLEQTFLPPLLIANHML